MQKSINAWAVTPGTAFETMFRQLSEAGFDAVELNVDADNQSGHSLTIHTTDEELREIRSLSESYHLSVSAVSSGLYWKTPLGSADKNNREIAKNVLRTQIYMAKALKADTILIVPGGIDENTSISHCYEHCHQELESLLREIVAAGVNVGLENTANGFFLSPGDMSEFIDSFDIPFIGAYFDMGNVLSYSYPEYWIEILDDRIVGVHAKDGRKTSMPGGYYEVPLLRGAVRWERVMTTLRSVGYEGPLTAETGASERNGEYLYRSTADALSVIEKL